MQRRADARACIGVLMLGVHRDVVVDRRLIGLLSPAVVVAMVVVPAPTPSFSRHS